MAFVYTPLLEGNQIRLLKVNPDPSADEFVCKFTAANLDDSSDRYIAITYAWDNQPPSSNLRFTVTSKPASNLPTWVPEFRYPAFNEPYIGCERENWNSGGPLETPATFVSANRLSLRACILDIVDVCCSRFNSSSIFEQKEAIREVLELQKRASGEGISQKSWEYTVVRCLIFGLDIEDSPAGPEYIEHFREWLGLL